MAVARPLKVTSYIEINGQPERLEDLSEDIKKELKRRIENNITGALNYYFASRPQRFAEFKATIEKIEKE